MSYAPKRPRMTKKHREAIFARDKGVCWLCAQMVAEDEPYDVDHVIPRELGGSDGDENLRIAHKPCHREKSKADVKAIAKSNRLHRANGPAEDRRQTKHPIRSRPFQKGPKQKIPSRPFGR